VRRESGEVAFPFQSFRDSGESAAGRMPVTVHPLSARHVEFDRDGYVSSEFVSRSSCPPTVPMSDDAYRKRVVYGSSKSGLHIGRHSRKCVEYRCI